jgi:hypothetical protein
VRPGTHRSLGALMTRRVGHASARPQAMRSAPPKTMRATYPEGSRRFDAIRSAYVPPVVGPGEPRREGPQAGLLSCVELVFPGLLRPDLHLFDEDLAAGDLGRIRKNRVELLLA